MNQPIFRHLLLALALLTIVLFIPAFITAQEDAPEIPHQLERRADCLGCHAEGKLRSPVIPDNEIHAQATNDVCQDCHQLAGASPDTDADAESTAQREPPAIPHTLERRADCLGCHAEGRMGSPVIPEGEIHAEATNDDCQGCHESAPPIPHTVEGREDCVECHVEGGESAPAAGSEGEAEAVTDGEEAGPTPAPTPEPIPTPIAYPKVKGVNTCLDCHAAMDDETMAEIATHWERSIHSERDVACVDCHGGNSSAGTKEEAKAPGTAYIGIPAKSDIPALCAACHADVVQMRQYDLPTDQYAKYQESIHGIRLVEGDDNVATCFDCHGGHLTLKANDPASSVYPANVPLMCADCHANEELMAPYSIPTNQFSLYQDSVHGHALLDEQDFRAPNCATCHGTHGAAPPGFEEVANVCGSCHSATQDHYVTSPHGQGDELAPKCVTCHGRYDVTPPTEELYLGSEDRRCGECHSEDSEPGRVAQTLYANLTTAAASYEEAEAAIEAAREVGMLVSPLEGRLREANTDLVSAEAVQHTLDVEAVSEHTDRVIEISDEVTTSAEAAIAQSIFRRRAMVIAVAAIALTIVALYLLKRELDKQMEDEA